MAATLISLAVLYAAFAAFAHLAADRLIFPAPRPSYDARRLGVSTVAAEDGARIAVLHLANPAARHTVLYSHGNGEDLGMALPGLEALHRAGFAVVAYDYRGYGASGGGPATARGVLRDAEAVYRHVVGPLGVDPSRVIVYGYSVGSGPAVHLAARVPVGGLVVENGFVSAFRVLTRAPLLPFDRFPNLRDIRRVRVPVLVIHGVQDRVVPAWHGRRLFEAAPGPRDSLWVEGAGHTDVAAVAGRRYTAALRAFAGRIGGEAPARQPRRVRLPSLSISISRLPPEDR